MRQYVHVKKGDRLAFALLLGVCVALLTTAVVGGVAQDWVPFHVASRLALMDRWDSVYPPADARDVFDVPPMFQQEAARDSARDGSPAFPASSLTGFISPPPGALLQAPLAGLRWETRQLIWLVALALPLTVSIVVFGYTSMAEGLAMRWGLICAAGFPLLLYTVAWGQPSAWVATAAIVSVIPGRRWLDGLGSTTLGLGVLTKATPLIVAVGLWWCGRRRMSAGALVVAGAITVITVVFAGWTPWFYFAGNAFHLLRTVQTDWNNASVDAALIRLVTGAADSALRSASGSVAIAALMARLALLGLAGWYVLQKRCASNQRVSAVWIGWLASFQLLWVHYMTALLPLLACRSNLRTPWAVASAALLSTPIVLRASGANALITGQVAMCAWLMSAMVILWPRFDGHTATGFSKSDNNSAS